MIKQIAGPQPCPPNPFLGGIGFYATCQGGEGRSVPLSRSRSLRTGGPCGRNLRSRRAGGEAGDTDGFYSEHNQLIRDTTLYLSWYSDGPEEL